MFLDICLFCAVHLYCISFVTTSNKTYYYYYLYPIDGVIMTKQLKKVTKKVFFLNLALMKLTYSIL